MRMPRERINIGPTTGTSRFNGTSLDETLAGTRVITEAEIEKYQFFNLDPGGAGRTVTLPAEAVSKGAFIFVANTADAAEILTIQDDAAATVCTPTQNEVAVLWCNGTAWHGMAGAES